MEILEELSWELSVLSRSVAYNNLSGAASQVGLSQPQLSRIVSKLEEKLDVLLLDRTVRRKSAWTPQAFQLAELYSKSVRDLSHEVAKLIAKSEPQTLRIGTLEGLLGAALKFVEHALDRTGLSLMELDVFDLNVLEEKFLNESLDIILSVREPGRKKYAYSKRIGFQLLEQVVGDPELLVLSPFEYNTSKRSKEKSKTRILISNSLEVRKEWIRSLKGSGSIPGPVSAQKPRKADENEVLLLGSERIGPRFWEKLKTFEFKGVSGN